MSMKNAMGAHARERREKRKTVAKSLREQHPTYTAITIEVMTSYQLGGWDLVDELFISKEKR